MGCGSCGTMGADGKPAGCQSNGGCTTGGCNKLNVFDWLAELPISDFGKPFPIVEISFNEGSRKEFYKNPNVHHYDKGSMVTVEGVNGYDVGQISLSGELVKLQLKKYSVAEKDVVQRILRSSTQDDLDTYYASRAREKEVLVRARAIARQHKLDMKVSELEIQADGKKIALYYTSHHRVDFRELIKVYATEFGARIEMKQIGARQESAKVGGIGSCGRELCCSTWLTDFKTVYTSAARYQNLSINQTKLSGQCGKLKCCLNYELDTYMEALQDFPDKADSIEVRAGKAYLAKKDIFKKLMWYNLSGNSKQYPLTIERVLEIQAANKRGEKPEELGAIEIVIQPKDGAPSVDAGFVNDVGQLTLGSIGKKKKKSSKNKSTQGNKNRNPEDAKASDNNESRQKRDNRPGGVKKPQGDRNTSTAIKDKDANSAQGNKRAQQGNKNPNVAKLGSTENSPRTPRPPRPPREPRTPKDEKLVKPRGQGEENAGNNENNSPSNRAPRTPRPPKTQRPDKNENGENN